MALRGEHFVVNLSDEEGDSPDIAQSFAGPSLDLIGDIMERTPTAAPPAPRPPSASNGFPAHKRRLKQSTFKQRKTAQEEITSSESSQPAGDRSLRPTQTDRPSIEEEKRLIDEENRRRLESMTPAQAEKERAELMSGLSPSLIERLLRRANIDEGSVAQHTADKLTASGELNSDTELQGPEHSSELAESTYPNTSGTSGAQSCKQPPAPSQTVTPTEQAPSTSKETLSNEDLSPPQPPGDLHPASELPSGSIHFPTPPPRQSPMPNLDPSSPSFLADLQSHYFPDTPHNPSALSWMQAPSTGPEDPDACSAYHPASTVASVSPSAIRFSLLGTILSPSTSLSLPTSLGLHHHASDPQAAGYTIPEVAILSRSTIPAQRCVAWQVIGRILFRLGKGEFGERGSTLVEGLWSVIEKEGVVAGMLTEADGCDPGSNERDRERECVAGGKGGIGRHASAKAWALEGVWLWRLGGGGDRGLPRNGIFRSQ